MNTCIITLAALAISAAAIATPSYAHLGGAVGATAGAAGAVTPPAASMGATTGINGALAYVRTLRSLAKSLVTPGRLELPAYGLGNRRSILLSYGVTRARYAAKWPHFASHRLRCRLRTLAVQPRSARATTSVCAAKRSGTQG
jgi:hypothetical protein